MSRHTFRTSISVVSPGAIAVRGYALEELMERASWVDVIALVVGDRRLTPAQRKLLEAILCSAADHGFVATCIAAARYAVSGSGSLAGGVAAGILSMGAYTAVPRQVGELLHEIAPSPEVAAGASDERIDAVIRGYLARQRRIPGLGHPVHKERDPRTEALRRVARGCGLYEGYIELVDRVRDRVEAVSRHLVLNVDGIIAAGLLQMGFAPDETLGLTILALVPSLVGHVLEEIHDGSPMRIIPDSQVRYGGVGELHSWQANAQQD